MGIVSFLFASQSASGEPAPAVAPSSEASAAPAQSPTEGTFATADWVVRKAFDQIMTSVDLAPDRREALFTAYAAAHRSGGPRAEEQAVTSILIDSGWRWHDFDTWSQRFEAAKEWPYMWHHFRELSEPEPTPPTTSHDAVSLLKAADMTAFAKERVILPKPAPRKRTELEALLITQIPLPELQRRVRNRFNEAVNSYCARREIAKCKLLAHTLAMTSYAIRDAEQRKTLTGTGYRLEALANAGCPIEDRFAAEFNAGGISGLPPYFPGDRTMILCRVEFPQA
jgi:hypothetical protein